MAEIVSSRTIGGKLFILFFFCYKKCKFLDFVKHLNLLLIRKFKFYSEKEKKNLWIWIYYSYI